MTHSKNEAVEEIVRALERHYGPLAGRKRWPQLASEVPGENNRTSGNS